VIGVLPSDWVVATALVVIAFIVIVVARWRSGTRRSYRINLSIEHEYLGPDAQRPGPPKQSGPSLGVAEVDEDQDGGERGQAGQ